MSDIIIWPAMGRRREIVSECGRYRIGRMSGKDRNRYILQRKPFFEAGSVVHYGGTLAEVKRSADRDLLKSKQPLTTDEGTEP